MSSSSRSAATENSTPPRTGTRDGVEIEIQIRVEYRYKQASLVKQQVGTRRPGGEWKWSGETLAIKPSDLHALVERLVREA